MFDAVTPAKKHIVLIQGTAEISFLSFSETSLPLVREVMLSRILVPLVLRPVFTQNLNVSAENQGSGCHQKIMIEGQKLATV